MSNPVAADRRFNKTLQFLKDNVNQNEKILDLGTPNLMSKAMQEAGYKVFNTSGEDFDVDFIKIIDSFDVDTYTSFEVFEHLFAPYNLLKEIPTGKKLVCSVPLKVWFSKAYWNEANDWDKHYHEFEPRQFDFLLQKTGWKIIKKELWTSPDKFRFGIRPLLRFIFPSYYFVVAEKVS